MRVINYVLNRTLYYTWIVLQQNNYNLGRFWWYLLRHTPLTPRIENKEVVWENRILTIGIINILILAWYYSFALEVVEIWNYSPSGLYFWWLAVGIAVILLIFAQSVFLTLASLGYSFGLIFARLFVPKN